MATAAQLIVARFTELLESGNVDLALNYLSEDIIYNSWVGVVEGRINVVTFLKDNIRYSHHKRRFTRWRQTDHSMDPALREHAYDAEGYDRQGFATFERDGTIASRPKFSWYSIPVKETIVIERNAITLINVTKRI